MHRPTLTGICFALLVAGLARAQYSPPASAAGSIEKNGSSRFSEVTEVRPPLFYLEDERGELKPAFGFSLEDFLRAYNQLHHIESGSRPAGYVVRKLDINGKTEDRFARLTVSVEVAFQEDGTFHVPLALGQAVIDGDLEYTGKGTPLIYHEENKSGYVVRIEGEADSSQRLTLKVLTPVMSVGERMALRLTVPSATMAELRLIVPLADATATAPEGTVVRTSPFENGAKTELSVQGFRGDFELTWSRPEASPAANLAVLESSGEVLAMIDSRGIQWNATLRVRGHGGVFDRIHVRLPVDAELLPNDEAEYQVVAASNVDSSSAGGRIVEVRLREKTLGPVTIHLSARRALDESTFGKWVEMAGFSVVGAARQWGHLAVQVADDLEALFDPQWGVRQTDELPESLAGEDTLAGFEFATVPGSLLARIAPSRTRVSVEPQYVLVAGAEEIQLTAVLRYGVRGKKIRVLDVDLAGWEYDEIGPDNLVAVDKVMEDDSGVLSIPLLRPSSSKMEVTLRAHRHVKADEANLELTFPRPLGAASSPAAIAIIPEDNVQLTVDTDATKGMLRQQASPPMTVPRRQQTPTFYRGDPATAFFVARRDIHTREIAVRSTTIVELDSQAGQIKQRFTYKIDYEPCDALLLRVARELADSDQLDFRVDGQRVSPANVTRIPTAESPDGSDMAQIQVALGSPRIGMCNLDVRYPLAPHRLAPRSSLRRVVPLVVPLDGVLVGNRLIATTPPELRLTMAEGPWKKEGSTAAPSSSLVEGGGGESVLEFAAEDRVGEAELLLCLEARELTHATVVQRAFVQTWLARRARRDRAVFHFITHEKSVLLVLPEHAILAETRVLLNGKAVEASPTDQRSLRLDMPDAFAGQPCVLEVDCHDARPQTIRGRQTLELPRLGESTWVRRFYWQLTLPRNEHVINVPAGLVREFRWKRNGLFWGRNPSMDTTDLEAWVGLPEPSDEPTGNDSYLFSSFGRSHRFELLIAGRSWIVLGSSGIALLIGLLLIYVPASRHPAGLVALAVALGCAGLLYPEATLLAMQAAGVGLALTVLAALLEYGVSRRRRGLVLPEKSGSRIELGSTQTQFIVSSAGGGSTTAPLERPPTNRPPSSVLRAGAEDR